MSIASPNRSVAEQQVREQSLRGAKALWKNSQLNKLQTPVTNQCCRELKSEVLVQALANQYIREDSHNKQGFLEACGPLREMVGERSIADRACRIDQIARHILVVDVAGDGYCQLRALFASTRPNFLPEKPGNIFCQLNSSQLFKISIIGGIRGSVAHPDETQAVGERIQELLKIWNDPQNPNFTVVLDALLAEMADAYTAQNDNDSVSIRNLQKRAGEASGQEKQNLEQEICQRQLNRQARHEENQFLFDETKGDEWFRQNKAKLDQGLERILNSISGDLWFTFYSKVRNVPIQTFNQSQDDAKKTFIQTSVFKPARNYQDKPLACVVKVGAHWKAAILLDEFKFSILRDFELIDKETQVFHASDHEPNKWYLEGGHQDKEIEIEASKPIKLTSDLKNLCDKAHTRDQNARPKIEEYLKSVLGELYNGYNFESMDRGWFLSVTTKNGGEYIFTSDCDLEQNPVAAGGGAAGPKTSSSAAKPAAAIAARPPVQSAAAGGGAAEPKTSSSAAKPAGNSNGSNCVVM